MLSFYLELIDLFEQTADCLIQKFKSNYPDIYIGRPKQFYERLQQIVAPTRPSLRCESSLKILSAIQSYCRRTLRQCIRNLVTGLQTWLHLLNTYKQV